MKKAITLSILFIMSLSVQAQIDFFKFIESIKWNSTESEIAGEYATLIKQRKHIYNESDKSVCNYGIDNIILGDYAFNVWFKVDSLSKKLVSLYFYIPKELLKDESPKQLCGSLDVLLSENFGTPDSKKDGEGILFSNDRKWHNENIVIDVKHIVVDKMQLYTIEIKERNEMTAKEFGLDKLDFRVASWGESRESILMKEGKKDKAGIENLYSFDDYVAGMNCSVVYEFVENKLSGAYYVFNVEHTNENDYIQDFNRLIELLSEKYGNPAINMPIWKNSLYKNDKDKYGFAISLGHLIYYASWDLERSDITVKLGGENYNITFVSGYRSKVYKGFKNNENRKKELEKL